MPWVAMNEHQKGSVSMEIVRCLGPGQQFHINRSKSSWKIMGYTTQVRNAGAENGVGQEDVPL